MATLTKDRVTEMLSDLEDYETELNDWETKFIASMNELVEQSDEEETKFSLTYKQATTLENIYNKYCKESST